MKSFLILTFILISTLMTTSMSKSLIRNDRPIIGILSQELTPKTSLKYPGMSSYIAASYVKYIEGAGARVVPILIGQTEEYYEDILNKINGVLLPGGATYFNNTNGYCDSGEIIYRIVENMNERGIYMPIWGTCLGFELLTYLSADRMEHRTDCSSQSQSLPLLFMSGYNNSKLLGDAPENVLWTLAYKNSTSNFHRYCTTRESFNKFKLNRIWKVLSVSFDWNGLEFISLIEHKKYPIYGCQFHPEKNIYEFIPNRNISHESDAIATSQYFANFFVNEARKNFNSFDSESEEEKYLIYNYNATFTGIRRASVFEQVYYFK